MQQLCFWRWVNNLKTNQLYWGVLPHISRFYPEFFIICGFLPSQCNKWLWPACASDMPGGLIDTFAQQLAHTSKPNSCQPLPYFVNCQDFLFWVTKFQSVEAPLETQPKYVGPHVNSRPSVDHICSLVSCTENYSTAILPWSLVGEQSLFNRSWIVIQTLQTLLLPQFWSWQALATRWRKGTESRFDKNPAQELSSFAKWKGGQVVVFLASATWIEKPLCPQCFNTVHWSVNCHCY